MFRVPFVMGTQESVLGNSHGGERENNTRSHSEGAAGAEGGAPVAEAAAIRAASTDPARRQFSSDPWGLERPGDSIYELDRAVQTDPRELDHVKLVREAMQYWQSYDAFSRVSMSIGTNQLVVALSYYVLGYVLVSNHAVVASWLAVTMFMAIACALIRLDMSLTASQFVLAVCLVVCGPLCMAIIIRIWATFGTVTIVQLVVPVIYLSQALWLNFVLYVCNVREQANGVQLPTGFRSVLYIDVFGWIKGNAIQRAFNSSTQAPSDLVSQPLLPQERTNGSGPAMDAVRYEGGRPEPMRVDQLPGAARPTRAAQMKDSHFTPASFVPREKDAGDDIEAEEALEAGKAGTRPWRVFAGATSLLSCLWIVTGVFVSMESCGWTSLQVLPISIVDQRSALLYLGHGSHMRTIWPHENVHTVGLACDTASDALVASTRFGLYTASLTAQDPHNALHFKPAPFCEDIEGEALQDVALQCDSKDSCKALVLNQHGRRLAKCNISAHAESHATHLPSASFVSEEWLADADVVRRTTAESLLSLAFVPSCGPDVPSCAYVGTSNARIVELQQMADTTLNSTWFPRRLLHSKLNATSSGAMSIIQGRYLGVLQLDGRHVSFVDLEDEGAAVESWTIPVPASQHKWSAMCAAGDQLYFLSSGPSPQISHFAVPQHLSQAGLNQEEAPKPNSISRKHRTSQVSLSVSVDAGEPIRHSLRR